MTMEPDQRRRIRRTALVLGLVALAIYAGYIAYWMWRGSH
jgi:hypothetical protein